MRVRIKMKRWRLKKRMSQSQFALAVGITRRAVIYLEAGVREPSYRTVEKFESLKSRHEKAEIYGK